MALVKCAECAHDVSTTAQACPNCGSKPPRVAGRFTPADKWLMLLAVLGALTVAWLGQSKARPAEQAAALPDLTSNSGTPDPPPTPAPPSHNYVYQDGIEYGYQPALTKEDRDAGTLSKPLQMIAFNRFDAQGIYWFKARSILGGVDTFTCQEPCDVMKITSQGPGDYFRQVSMPIVPGSILAAVMQDARNGYLKPVWRPSKRPQLEAEAQPANDAPAIAGSEQDDRQRQR